jgi:hypothetical protein
MSDVNMTVRQIEDFFVGLTYQILGIDPSTLQPNKSPVRVDWPTGGAPGWKIDEDVTFIMVNYDDDAITRQVDVIYQSNDESNAFRSASSTRVLRINWICYGPNSFDNANNIRNGLFLPQFSEMLMKNNFALIFDMPSPLRAPELFNGQWWDRTSFYARFNELITQSVSVPYLTSPNVQIVKG